MSRFRVMGPAIGLAAISSTAAWGQYSISFESPYSASAAGISATDQLASELAPPADYTFHGPASRWYHTGANIPAGSLPGFVHTYLGNERDVSQLAGGADNFLAVRKLDATGANCTRAQKQIPFGVDGTTGLVTVSYDMNGHFDQDDASDPDGYVNNLGSFSFQPYTAPTLTEPHAGIIFPLFFYSTVADALPHGDVEPNGGDRDVDLSDLSLLLANFGTSPGPGAINLGDIEPCGPDRATTGDGDIDLGDLSLLLANFGASAPPVHLGLIANQSDGTQSGLITYFPCTQFSDVKLNEWVHLDLVLDLDANAISSITVTRSSGSDTYVPDPADEAYLGGGAGAQRVLTGIRLFGGGGACATLAGSGNTMSLDNFQVTTPLVRPNPVGTVTAVKAPMPSGVTH